jgi:small nuclear ribonucleoprotein (snRNP)-like protein
MDSPASASPKSGNLKLWIVLSGVLCLLIGLVLGHMVTFHWMRHDRAAFGTPYQAVQLINGAVYYGKLSGYGTRNPVLTDVFYIVSKTDPETKQVTNILVKRGKELHGPDRMYINPSQIVMVEPVGPDSKVAQLINEASH